jgi:Fic family protein
MSLKPDFQITALLLKNIKEIYLNISDLNHRKFPKPVLAEYEHRAVTQSAFSSTSIEGNPLPLTEVKKVLKSRPENQRESETEVINYNDTLLWLNGEMRKQELPLNQKLVVNIHSRLMKNLMPKIKLGKYRLEPVFVNDPKKGKPIYWPPDHQDVSRLMSALIDYIKENSNQIDPIVLAGIFHKQFVIIHPFADGNGRTVRLMTKSLLAQMGLDTFHLFSFENYYNRNVSRYFSEVGELGNYYEISNKVSFTSWLEYFSAGILDELLRVKKELESIGPLDPADRLNRDQEKLMAFIDKHGSIRDLEYSKITSRAKATRILDFAKLLELGYIERFGKGPATHYRRKS